MLEYNYTDNQVIDLSDCINQVIDLSDFINQAIGLSDCINQVIDLSDCICVFCMREMNVFFVSPTNRILYC